MARTELVRHHCNGCGEVVDVPIGGKRPADWQSFLVQQKEPSEGTPIYVDLCPGDALGFLDIVQSPKGPHRPQGKPEKEAP